MSLQKHKKLAYILAVVTGLISLAFAYYWQHNSGVNSVASTPQSSSISEGVESNEITDPGIDENIYASFVSSENSLTSDGSQQNLTNNQNEERSDTVLTLDENWCDPREQLSDEDISYLATIQQDWNEIQGFAPANTPDVGYGDELYDQSSAYIEPYLAMEIDKLESLALNGDKWAMIAYLQKSKAFSRRPVERRVAKELLISGATYHALEFFIQDELLQAKAIFRKTQASEGTREHLVNAVAYTMLGLKNYNTSALVAYVSNVSNDEIFVNFLNPSLILKEYDDEIIARFGEITREVRLARKLHNISEPEVPSEIKRLFARDLALYKVKQEAIMAQLHSWQGVTIGDLGISECTEEQMARIAKMNN